MFKKAVLFVLVFAFLFSLVYAGNISSVEKPVRANKNNIQKGLRVKYDASKADKLGPLVKIQAPKDLILSQSPKKFKSAPDGDISADGMHTVVEDLDHPGSPKFPWYIFSWSPPEYYKWGTTSNNPYRGNGCGWCAERGGPPDLDAGVDNYANNMYTWAIAGPVDLIDNMKWADLEFYLDGDWEYYWDWLYVGASADGFSFWGYYLDDFSYTGGYVGLGLDLEPLVGGDLNAISQVWVCFIFYSDYSITYGGAWLDEITMKFHYYDPTDVSFEGMPIAGKAPLEVQFTNNCGGVPTHFVWDFGDGTTLPLQEGWPDWTDPVHIYNDAGLYSVTLDASGQGGDDVLTIPDMIYVDPVYDYLEMEVIDQGETNQGDSWENAIDHDIYGGGAVVTAIADDAWATFDFGDVATIHKLRLLTNTAEDQEFVTNCTKDFEIWASTDGEDFGDGPVFSGTCEEYKYGQWDEFDLDTPIVARYIVLLLTSSKGDDAFYRELVEFQAFGTVKEPCIAVTPDTLNFSVETDALVAASQTQTVNSNSVNKLATKFTGVVRMPSNSEGFTAAGVLDTLSNNYDDGDIYYFGEDWQVFYEATKLIPAQPCTLKSIWAAFYNYKTSTKTKTVQILVWEDNGGVPGSELLAVEAELTMEGEDAAWFIFDVSDYDLVLTGPFWVGHYEPTAGPPTSLADDVPTPGANFYSEDGATWVEDEFDYLHMATVEYGEGEEGKTDTQIMTVSNECEGDLFVSEIFGDEFWVTAVDPSSFTLAEGESQEVEVTVNSQFLTVGTYTGTLHIMSNDPDTPDFEEPLVFDITGTGLRGQSKETTSEAGSIAELPTKFNLSQNYPNPFNPETNICFELPEDADVALSIYNVQGQLINTLVNGQMNAGYHNYIWNGTNSNGEQVAGGVYIYKLSATTNTKSINLTSKMILMK